MKSASFVFVVVCLEVESGQSLVNIFPSKALQALYVFAISILFVGLTTTCDTSNKVIN